MSDASTPPHQPPAVSTGPDFAVLHLQAGDVFRPSSPIDRKNLFAGRLEQLAQLADALRTRGQHAVVYGERGVGKTSLVSILGSIAWSGPEGPYTIPTFRENCHRDDTFGRIWRRSLDLVEFEVKRPTLGFNAEVRREAESLASSVSDDPSPDEVVKALRQVNVPLHFVFDEFDQIADKNVSHAFAEVMKALSDYAVPSKLVVVGVGDTVDSLIASHASVERALRQIRMPRMQRAELAEIIAKATEQLGMTCEDAARERIVRLSQGLPHYVHSLGLQAARSALSAGSLKITMASVTNGIAKALEHASQSLLDAYVKASSSPQKDSLYKHVLVACALAKTDDLAWFAPASIRAPLKKMGRELEIPAFAGHLNKFASPDRGNVLQKTGTTRRFRYRFSNPLLQPFVVMRGIADGLVTADAVDHLLKTAKNAPETEA